MPSAGTRPRAMVFASAACAAVLAVPAGIAKTAPDPFGVGVVSVCSAVANGEIGLADADKLARFGFNIAKDGDRTIFVSDDGTVTVQAWAARTGTCIVSFDFDDEDAAWARAEAAATEQGYSWSRDPNSMFLTWGTITDRDLDRELAKVSPSRSTMIASVKNIYKDVF